MDIKFERNLLLHYKVLTVRLDQLNVSLLHRLFIVFISLQKINVINLKLFHIIVNKADIKVRSPMSEDFEHSHCSMPVSFIALPTSQKANGLLL